MFAGARSQGGVLRKARAGGLGVIRLLLLALAIQLVLPVFAAGPMAAKISVEADIALSMCHDSNSDSAPARSEDGIHAKHCVFCLPLVGGVALQSGAPVIAAPGVIAASRLQLSAESVPAGQGRHFSHARAPPAASRLV